ncbi:periplasmic nitrate reductase, NapE protein [Azospirillum argentinense]
MNRRQTQGPLPDPVRFPARPAANPPLPDPGAKRREIAMFLILAVVIWPILSVAIVGGYGFLVWMSQLIMGPPGPPPV